MGVFGRGEKKAPGHITDQPSGPVTGAYPPPPPFLLRSSNACACRDGGPCLHVVHLGSRLSRPPTHSTPFERWPATCIPPPGPLAKCLFQWPPL